MNEPEHRPEPGSENVVAFKRRPAPLNEPKAAPQSDEDRARVRTNVAALILAAILVALGWLLVRKLDQSTRIEDCLMAGRSNCAPVDTTSRDQ
jgi:hypothetical protein